MTTRIKTRPANDTVPTESEHGRRTSARGPDSEDVYTILGDGEAMSLDDLLGPPEEPVFFIDDHPIYVTGPSTPANAGGALRARLRKMLLKHAPGVAIRIQIVGTSSAHLEFRFVHGAWLGERPHFVEVADDDEDIERAVQLALDELRSDQAKYAEPTEERRP